MKTLPNGVRIFNATPHVIRFWREGWNEPVEVAPDEVVSAKIVETNFVDYAQLRGTEGIEFVTPKFVGTVSGRAIINRIYRENPAALIVGSIIAAQAYPQQVVGMTPAPGYERVHPAEKRMNPDKFTVFR